MNKDISDILQALEEYKQTADSVGIDLRLDLSRIIAQGLRRKGWTQRELARRTSLKEPYISRILHSDANCTFATAGKLLFAFGLRASIREIDSDKHNHKRLNTTSQELKLVRWEQTHGEAIKQKTAQAEESQFTISAEPSYVAFG